MGVLMLEVGGRKADAEANGKLWIGTDFSESGWWDSGETLWDEETDSDRDGAADPVEVNVGPKRVDVTLLADASSPEWADTDIRVWASSLPKLGTDLGFRVYNAGRWLYLRNAKIRGRVRVRPNRRDMRLTDIEFTVWSHDPRKYGEPQSLPLAANASDLSGLEFDLVDDALEFTGGDESASFPGVFTIANKGTADFYPWFRVSGPLDSFTITSDGNVIEYAAPVGADQELILSPYLGGRAVLDGTDVSTNLTQAGWVPVDGHQTRSYLFTPEDPGAGSTLTVEYWDGAWW
jgi:hypothetical protein